MTRAAWLLAAVLFAAALPERSVEPLPCTASEGGAGLLCGVPLDLNRASPADLEALPGIGPARAAALVEARPFARVGDVLHVRGIGRATLRRVSDWVEVRP